MKELVDQLIWEFYLKVKTRESLFDDIKNCLSKDEEALLSVLKELIKKNNKSLGDYLESLRIK